MRNIVDRFGSYVSDNIETHPSRINSILSTTYKIYERSLMLLMAGKKLTRYHHNSRLYGYAKSCEWIIRGLEHPEKSAMVNLFFPSEILIAMDINPVFVEGISGFMRATKAERGFIDYMESNDFPKSLCTYHKIALASAYTKVLNPIPLVLNTTAYCDANMLTFKALSQAWGVPHYQIDIPSGEYSEEKLFYVKDQIESMIPLIEDTYKKKLDMDQLRAVIVRENKITALQKKAFELTKRKYFAKTTGEEMNQYFYSHPLKGSKACLHYYERLVDDLEHAPSIKDEPHKKIFWVHTLPQGIQGINDFLDESGPLMLTYSDVNLDMLKELNTEDPILALAERVMKNVLRPNIEARIQQDLKRAKELDVDGIIYFNHWGCKMTLGGSQLAKETFEEAGIPTLILEGDSADPKNTNIGQMLTRIQAFAESLEER